MDLYRDAGYLDASFDRLDRNIDNPAADKINVDLVGSIKADGQYHVAKIVWPGSPQISEKEFADAGKLHSGDLASQKELRASLAIIDTAYRRQGYMDVIVDASPQLDSAAHLVTFTVNVDSRAQYHFGELNVLNLAPEAVASWMPHGNFGQGICTTKRIWSLSSRATSPSPISRRTPSPTGLSAIQTPTLSSSSSSSPIQRNNRCIIAAPFSFNHHPHNFDRNQCIVAQDL